eukprot:jgi/Psemu1/300977/fgenesh1_kg.23_\
MTLSNLSSYHFSYLIVLYLLSIPNFQATSEALTVKTPICTPPKSEYANSFRVRLNEFFKGPVPDPIRTSFSIFREEANGEKLDVEDVVTLLTAAPGAPGVPRPLWLVMLGSLPTGLLWYGYYKFVVEEELLQMELDSGKEPRGFGGYGTLGPFTYGMLAGPLASMLDVPGGMYWSSLGVAFIYYTQFLLYDRVNKLYEEDECYRLATIADNIEDSSGKPTLPLQVWWCLPIFFPFNFIVGLRQVHFLSQYLYRQRGDLPSSPTDPIAEFFPFIKKASLTLWCSVFSDVESFDLSSLPEPIREVFTTSRNGIRE